jgi:ribonuclease D
MVSGPDSRKRVRRKKTESEIRPSAQTKRKKKQENQERGRAEKATVGLGTLVETELAEHLAKDDRIRRSQWGNANLTEEQKEYGALDVIKGHEVFIVLKQYPDLTERLDSRLANPGALAELKNQQEPKTRLHNRTF